MRAKPTFPARPASLESVVGAPLTLSLCSLRVARTYFSSCSRTPLLVFLLTRRCLLPAFISNCASFASMMRISESSRTIWDTAEG